MSWADGPMAPFDVESTGISVFDDRIVTAALGKVNDGGTVMRSWKINPGVPIPPGATAIHGITDEMAAAYTPAPDALNSLAAAVVDVQLDAIPIVGWNVVYDLSILDAELRRHHLPTLEQRLGRPVGPVVDGLLLDKQTDRYRKGSRKLVDVAKLYRIELSDADAHGAEADALAAARVIWRIAKKHPEVGGMRLDALHAAQIEWCAEQAAGFRAYREKQGQPFDDIDGTWPVRVAPSAVAA